MTVGPFELFKIGIGPSSSHTVGPMRAAAQFAAAADGLPVARVRVDLFGSLGATGVGHGTVGAVIGGLAGETPDATTRDRIRDAVRRVEDDGRLRLGGRTDIAFGPHDVVRRPLTFLERHPNGMRFTALDAAGDELRSERMYSIGGGFVIGEHETAATTAADVPHPFGSAAELLSLCSTLGVPISEVVRRNELASRDAEEIDARLAEIARVMRESATRSCREEGFLPGGLHVRRRAKAWSDGLERDDPELAIEFAMERVNLIALAVNEENASGGRIVTAPTNGAAGIIPAVLFYALAYLPGLRGAAPEVHDAAAVRFLLTAAAIGSLCKERASISGAEVGCQGEVGSAASMAAAGLAELLGAAPAQVENAAEIAMEHNLGLTCDPVGGLVQIPCIERNAIAANNAVNAARMALRGDGIHHVSLDQVIETMRQTGADMSTKYKETSTGGLALNVPMC